MSPGESDQITSAAIARLAGVGRAAVSNWRRRYADFPEPVAGSPASPLFSRVEVEAWLVSTGKAGQLATAGRTDTGTQRIDEQAGQQRLRWNAVPSGTQRGTAERAITDLAASELLAKVMSSLLPRGTAIFNAGSGEDADAPVVLDPACSEGTVLMAVADRFGDRVMLVGQDIREPATAVAALNLRHHPNAVLYEIRTGDSLLNDQLEEYRGTAAAVVCEPPFDMREWPSAELTTDPRWEFGIPAPRDGELAWVQHCYADLRPNGVAVVAVTRRTCVQATGEPIRSALVRSGVLRSVIALPKGMSSVAGTDICLWLLRRPYGAPDHSPVRMVDLSSLGDAVEVPRENAAWQRLLNDADPAISRAVPRLELLDDNAALLPSRYIKASIDASAADLAEVTSRLQTIYSDIGRALPHFETPLAPVRLSYVTLGELERAGALRIRSRDATPLRGDLLLRTLGRPPVVATGSVGDDVGVAQVIEIDGSRLDAHFVAIFLRMDAGGMPVANTLGALSREDLRRCRVPRMPLAEQRQYGEAFRCLQELDGALASLASLTSKVIDQIVYGLTTGVLAPGLPATKSLGANANEGEMSRA